MFFLKVSAISYTTVLTIKQFMNNHNFEHMPVTVMIYFIRQYILGLPALAALIIHAYRINRFCFNQISSSYRVPAGVIG